ncbi:MAG: SRPBCC family protein [Bacteroidales bacterium]|nr:SRPBCC family protein [Bacteroidales bacterium]
MFTGKNSMTTIESKIGEINNNDKVIYNFLSDFNNFKSLIPQDKISNWESTEDTCYFNISGVGEFGMKITEKTPSSLIKISNSHNVPFDFNLWVQLKQVGENDTRIKLTIKANLNPMIKMVAKNPLQKMVDTIVDQLAVKFNK